MDSVSVEDINKYKQFYNNKIQAARIRLNSRALREERKQAREEITLAKKALTAVAVYKSTRRRIKCMSLGITAPYQCIAYTQYDERCLNARWIADINPAVVLCPMHGGEADDDDKQADKQADDSVIVILSDDESIEEIKPKEEPQPQPQQPAWRSKKRRIDSDDE